MTRPSTLLLLLVLPGCGFGLELFADDTGAGFSTVLDDTGVGTGDGGSDAGSGDGGSGDGGSGDAGSGDGGSGDAGAGDGGSGDAGSGDGGSGDGGGSGSAPTLSAVSATELGGRIEVSFQAADVDGDIEGGYLWMSINGTASTYNIPGQISDWRPSGTSTQYVTYDDCDAGSRFDFQLQAFDASGLGSAVRTDSVVLSGSAETITEVGDDGTYQTLGSSVTRGTTLCGDMHSTGISGSTYVGDLDFVRFRFATSGSYTFTLNWDESSANYDFSLFDSSWNYVGVPDSPSSSPPETFDVVVNSTSYYILRVAGRSGPGGAYSVSIN